MIGAIIGALASQMSKSGSSEKNTNYNFGSPAQGTSNQNTSQSTVQNSMEQTEQGEKK